MNNNLVTVRAGLNVRRTTFISVTPMPAGTTDCSLDADRIAQELKQSLPMETVCALAELLMYWTRGQQAK